MIAPHIPGKVTDQDNFILAGIASAIKLYDEQGVDYDREFYIRMMDSILGRYEEERKEKMNELRGI